MKIPYSKYFKLQERYLRPHLPKVIFLGSLILLNIAISVINPQIIKYIIDNALDPDLVDLSLVTNAAILFLVIALIQQIVAVLSVYRAQNLAWSSTNQMRFDLLEHCLNLDMKFHDEKRPGEMIQRIDGDVQKLSNFFSNLSLRVFANFLLIIAVLIALMLEHWVIGVAFAIFTTIALILMHYSSKLASPYWKKSLESDTELFGFVEERICGVEDIKANRGIEDVMMGYHSRGRSVYRNYYKAALVSSVTRIVIFTVVGLGTTLVYVVGIPLYQSETISIGSIFLISVYITVLFEPIFEILTQAQELQQADASIDRIEELFNIKTQVIDSGSLNVKDEPLDIKFENVNFGYLDEELVLKNLTFKLPAQKSLGIIGKTGSGKTTLSRLLFRLYDPSMGSIKINDIDIKEYSFKSLRESIAIVTQKVELFNGTLRENITLFDDSFPDEQIFKVLKDVGLWNWFEKLSDGLSSQIQSGESGLSAGEAQLLALTRVFLRKPKILILDEASSRLDPATETLIDKAVEKLLAGKTAIIIAHRLSTLNKVDNLLLIEQGEIIESGERTKLIKDSNSEFSKLLRTGFREVLA
ncbi:MAG: ABC transporter ATP-binding protein [Candidatus Hodarchaeales archaeon]|jgi:ABC-type multidrug transport system fused ATPase/permease subunit